MKKISLCIATLALLTGCAGPLPSAVSAYLGGTSVSPSFTVNTNGTATVGVAVGKVGDSLTFPIP